MGEKQGGGGELTRDGREGQDEGEETARLAVQSGKAQNNKKEQVRGKGNKKKLARGGKMA
jgi:hypothetical protein